MSVIIRWVSSSFNHAISVAAVSTASMFPCNFCSCSSISWMLPLSSQLTALSTHSSRYSSWLLKCSIFARKAESTTPADWKLTTIVVDGGCDMLHSSTRCWPVLKRRLINKQPKPKIPQHKQMITKTKILNGVDFLTPYWASSCTVGDRERDMPSEGLWDSLESEGVKYLSSGHSRTRAVTPMVHALMPLNSHTTDWENVNGATEPDSTDGGWFIHCNTTLCTFSYMGWMFSMCLRQLLIRAPITVK